MKRSWIGLGLLLAALAASLLVTWSMDRIHGPIARELETAADYALAGDWDRAAALASGAGTEWKKWAHFRGCFADHGPMEEIEANFAELEVYSIAREKTDFAASCGEIARKVKAMGEAHGLVWWNLF